jgi:hypothetical protein
MKESSLHERSSNYLEQLGSCLVVVDIEEISSNQRVWPHCTPSGLASTTTKISSHQRGRFLPTRWSKVAQSGFQHKICDDEVGRYWAPPPVHRAETSKRVSTERLAVKKEPRVQDWCCQREKGSPIPKRDESSGDRGGERESHQDEAGFIASDEVKFIGVGLRDDHWICWDLFPKFDAVEDTKLFIPQDHEVLFVGNHDVSWPIDGKQFDRCLEILGWCLHHLAVGIEDPTLNVIIGGSMNDKFGRVSDEDNTKREGV